MIRPSVTNLKQMFAGSHMYFVSYTDILEYCLTAQYVYKQLL